MNSTLRNVLAIVTGFMLGSLANMALIKIGYNIVPLPPGVDPSNMEALKAAMSSLEPKHFLFPFLAHAVGTMIGAAAAAMIGARHQFKLAMGIGMLFLCGGIVSVFMLPSPIWYTTVDLLGAYLPMAWIGGKLAAIRIKS